ncbi:2-C-methyl-D-erythritol 2,4-cyclodiphosphate synthase [Peptococcaceae bacterium CEB3]|nr:2-C-methyl-D-erythritol 2,4-cyclodiphosphate synthase [Peptococcaceae bacterium CEB3]
MDSVGVIIPAAGQGTRMGVGVHKQFLSLTGIPVLAHTLKIFQEAEGVKEIVVVGAAEDIAQIRELVRSFRFGKVSATPTGGRQRQESVLAGLQALSETIGTVVVHDGARPLLTLAELNRFLEEAAGSVATIMAVEVKDTIKRVDEAGWVRETLPRPELCAVQTPQLFQRHVLREAHLKARAAGVVATDDGALVEWLGQPVKVLPGSFENIKITTPEDLFLAERILEKRRAETAVARGVATGTSSTEVGPDAAASMGVLANQASGGEDKEIIRRSEREREIIQCNETEKEIIGRTESENEIVRREADFLLEPVGKRSEERGARTSSYRVGVGYDVHALVEGRPLVLGGVKVPYALGLLGHSDADVLVHAVTDALLGALALGDLGAHFPDTEEEYRGISSLVLLERVAGLMKERGYRLGNLDSILVAQKPKLAPYIPAMRANVARALAVAMECVSVKATTTERLGFAGREEGIAAQAMVHLEKTSLRKSGED